nr:venom acid phosphatase Acph-1-like [Onthophagus taurus]
MLDTATKLLRSWIFRHGDRTPDSLYPKDPYTEDDFYPFRIAHLTNKGKLRAYNIGTYLRKKYNKLLGDVYTPDILYGTSSSYPRCRASLESVLAGLYPPSEELIWNKELLWEPIPYDYLPMKENNLFLPVYTCPNMNTLVNDIYQNLDSDPIIQKYNYLLPFLVENTGLTGNLYSIAINLWSTLKSEEEAGLKIPIWAQTVYPEILSEITKYSWEVYSRTPDLKTLSSGFLMSKIINNTFSTLNGENEARNRKIYLYSGHDFNVGAVLSYLDNFVPHLINYGAHVIIEVHKYIGIYFLKVVRHGERTPDVLYPKDPYSEKDFYPFRVGHLTNKGKLTNYKVGTTLRQKYNKLLGDIYTPDVLYAVSSHLSRNKATLQGILAGLFTPSKELIWNKDLLWEPIPYDYLPKNENKLFSTLSTCPNWPILLAENYQKYLATDLVFQKYNYLLPFLLEKTAHDLNIASMLNFFDNFVPHNPNYGAHIIIEVHKYIGIYILKFLYQNNVGYLEPQPIFVPNCGIYCPLEVLVKLYAKELDPARLETLCG